MAHFLGEKLAKADKLTGSDRDAADAEIADITLRLWQHRAGASLERQPVSQLENIERALVRLDPKRDSWAYHDPFVVPSIPTETDVEVNSALELAMEFDRASGDLIDALIRYAAQIASDQEAEWVLALPKSEQDPFRFMRRLGYGISTDESEPTKEVTERANITAQAKAIRKAIDKIIGGVS
jgi:hypothetical protein